MNKKLYTQLNKEFVEACIEKFKTSDSIIITSHKSPDDDSISSALAMYYFLIEYLQIPGKKVRMVITGERVKRWDYFKYYDRVEFVEDLKDQVQGSELLVALDGSKWDRFSHKEDIDHLGSFSVCVDHHTNDIDRFDLCLQDSKASSTAQLVYEVFLQDQVLHKEICEIVLMGILGDTGNFRFVTPDFTGVFLVAERLVREGGIKIEDLQTHYDTISFKATNVLGKLLDDLEVRKVGGWPDFTFSYIDKEYLEKEGMERVNLDEGSTWFKEYLKRISGISWGFMISPGNGGYGINLRSIPGSVDVADMARRLCKIGGGHVRTAGGKLEVSTAKEGLEYVLDWMKNNKPVLS